MSFRILTHAKDYFNNWPSKEGTLWDQYYVCFILGIVGNKRGEVNQSNSDEIVRYIIQPYIKSKSAFLGLLTYAHLRQLGHKIDDRKLVRDSIDKIIDPNAQNSFSDYAINLMNEFAAGGFQFLKENIPDKPVSEQSYFYLDWHNLLKN